MVFQVRNVKFECILPNKLSLVGYQGQPSRYHTQFTVAFKGFLSFTPCSTNFSSKHS